MAGLDDLDRPAVDAVTVAGDDEALDRRREMILDRLGHRGGRLAGADHDRAAAARRGRQMGRDAGGGGSEGHTTELQSVMRRSEAACCLEKKTSMNKQHMR